MVRIIVNFMTIIKRNFNVIVNSKGANFLVSLLSTLVVVRLDSIHNISQKGGGMRIIGLIK